MTEHHPTVGNGPSEKGCADLHVHTNFSDGLFTPEKVVAVAKELGLRAVAITDHDCTEGIAPAAEAGEKCGVEIIPGIEISAAMGEDEIHILGYFIDSNESGLSSELERMKEGRKRRMKAMIKLLQEHGVNVKEEEVFAGRENGTIGRLHLARVLAGAGIVRDTKEAFDRYIGDGKPCYVKHEHLDYKDAINMIVKAGGVPVLAHPGAKGKNENISTYVKAGLRGIEASHTKHTESVKDIYAAMAKEYGILATGGSDCHGLERGKVLMGKVTVGYDVVDKLRSESWQKDRPGAGEKK